MRSSAWIWLFSSTESTTAFSGGSTKADDVLDLRDEVGIVGDLEAAHQMRLGVFRFGKLRYTEHLRRSEPERLKLWNPHRLLRRQLVRFL